MDVGTLPPVDDDSLIAIRVWWPRSTYHNHYNVK